MTVPPKVTFLSSFFFCINIDVSTYSSLYIYVNQWIKRDEHMLLFLHLFYINFRDWIDEQPQKYRCDVTYDTSVCW